jgi:homoserine kinase
MGLASAPVRVRAPATSANLGPGFDALGLALGLCDDVEAQVITSGTVIEVRGEGEQLPRDESNLVLRAMRAAFTRLGESPPGIRLSCTNRIPHGRGLGSSAAAIVTGVLLARALVADGGAALPDREVLSLATEVEGHPDNVAACLLGGLTVAWAEGDGVEAVRLECDPSLRPVALIPPYESATSDARGLLPDAVPHRDAAVNAGRAALLVAALTGTPRALLAATEDRLHQPYRGAAVPESAALIAALRADGHAAVLSGAGPTVLGLARDERECARVAASAPAGWHAMTLPVATRGAHLVHPER